MTPAARAAPADELVEPAAPQLPDALLRISTVTQATGLSSATLYRKLAAGQFPVPVRLGQRCTRWKASAVRAWIQAQGQTT